MRSDWKRNKQMLKNISEFPIVVLPNRQKTKSSNVQTAVHGSVPALSRQFEPTRRYRIRKECLINYFRFTVELVMN